MNEKVLVEHKLLIRMIFLFFEGSIRYEYLSDIVLKTKYKDVNSATSFSRLVTKLKKAKILNEMTDFDSKKRLYLNKPALAYLKGVETNKVSAVSIKTSTCIKSNFKACYFIENYIDKNTSNLSLLDLAKQSSKTSVNLFNKKDEQALNRIYHAFQKSLTDDAIKSLNSEKNAKSLMRKKQLENLKLGPATRKKQAEMKADNLDVYEEFYGTPIPKNVVSKGDKKAKQKNISLDNLKKNNVYLSDICIEDIEVKNNYISSVTKEDKTRIDYSAKFNNLTTKQVTLKFVYFCSAKEVKTSKVLSIYNDVKTYTDNLKVKDIVTKNVIQFVNLNRDKLSCFNSHDLSRIISNIKFDSHQVVKVVAELEVIFMNKINYERVIKKIKKHKSLKDQTTPLSYAPTTDYKISFRYYDFYAMNEHDPD